MNKWIKGHKAGYFREVKLVVAEWLLILIATTLFLAIAFLFFLNA